MKNVSVVICTYNGAKRLPDVLDRLRLQEGVNGVAWETIVVDNNSSDDAADVVRRYQENWPEHHSLRYMLERKPGKLYAMQRAVTEAEGELIGFLDDDNVPDLDWVAAVYHFAAEHPKAGSFGSYIRGEYEIPPPEGFGDIANLFAIHLEEQQFQYGKEKGHFPPGAGLVVRKAVWDTCVPATLRQAGPKAGSRAQASEDMELQWYIHKAGWEIWHNPAMRITHKIPASRLSEDYMLRLFQGVGLARFHLRMIRHAPWQRPLLTVAYMANDLIATLRFYVKYRRRKADIITRCRLNLHVYALISPLYNLFERRNRRVPSRLLSRIVTAEAG